MLFPAAREIAGETLVDALIGEHRKMEALVSAMRASPSQETLEEFLELLRSHIRKEENELFEALQAGMPPDMLEALGPRLGEIVVELCLDFGAEEP